MKPLADALSAMGINHGLEAPSSYERSFVIANRHRDLTRLRFAQAWTATNEGGDIVVSGQKTDGIDAFLKEIRPMVEIAGVEPKSHGKVFWMTRDADSARFDHWLKMAEPRKNDSGYFTSAGMFSAAKIDKGSAILVEHLTDQISGWVADLGAGWGFLSRQLLENSDNTERLDLFEADAAALECAKLNVTDDRASFHWEDVVSLSGVNNRYDWVISNPPFHQSRKGEPQLGQSFIETAARILKPSGQLLMVANRQLPYEATLSAKFRSVESLSQTSGFKVIVAKNPRPTKRR